MPKPIAQVAALATRNGCVCLVTSRSLRRWIIPKGHIDRGFSPIQAVAAEAWEEAGLKGPVDVYAIGHYAYRKFNRDYTVAVYQMRDPVEFPDWPERTERDREWVSYALALDRIDDPGLKAILTTLIAAQHEA